MIMRTAIAKAKTRVSQQETTRIATSVATKGSLAIMTGGAALVSLWSVACFTAAVVNSGPLAMLHGWFGGIAG